MKQEHLSKLTKLWVVIFLSYLAALPTSHSFLLQENHWPICQRKIITVIKNILIFSFIQTFIYLILWLYTLNLICIFIKWNILNDCIKGKINVYINLTYTADLFTTINILSICIWANIPTAWPKLPISARNIKGKDCKMIA